MRYSRPMSCAPLAFWPLGGPAQDQVVRAVAQRVGEVGGTAAELLHLDVPGQLGALARPATRGTASTSNAVLLADRRRRRRARSRRHCPAHRVESRGLLAHHLVVRRPVGQLELRTPPAPPRRAGSAPRRGPCPRAPRPRCPRARAERRRPGRRSPRRRRCRPRVAGRMFSISLVRKYEGHTTEQRTSYSASSWEVVSLNATTPALTAL